MKQIVKKSKNFRDAEEWDIEQHTKMSSEERQKAAKKLRERVYGKNPPDIRKVKEPEWKSPTFLKISKSL